MPASSPRVGDVLICPGLGAGRVEPDDPEHLLLRLSATGDVHRFSLADAATALRPPMSPSEAARRWSDLTTPADPDPRPWAERFPDLMATLRAGDPDDQVAALRTQYATPTSPAVGEFRLIVLYENALLSELAVVLARPFDDLQTEARAVAATFGAGRG